MATWLQTTNKNKSRFSIEKIPVVTRMGDINARLDQSDEKVNKRYAKLKANIDKNNNELTRLREGIEQGISAFKENQKKTQESLDNILAILPLHISFPPSSHNPPLRPLQYTSSKYA